MVTFNDHIKPLFHPFVNCMSQVQVASNEGVEEARLDNYAFVRKFHSRILVRLKGVNEFGQPVPLMPPGGLPEEDIILFEQWIADGMPENEINM
jgi:hypothetical protein